MEPERSVLAVDNVIFWVFFILMGFFVFLWSVEIAIGLLVVMVGVHKIGGEIKIRRLTRERDNLQETLEEVREWVQKDYDYTKKLSEKYETRFFNVTKNRGEVDKKVERKIEKNYREIVKQMVKLENKMNDITRVFLKRQPRSGR